MTLRWILAALHLIALGIGLGAVWTRARALRGALDRPGLNRVFAADGLWGLAAILWIGTGVARLFMGLEKSPRYYFQNDAFWGKMGMLALILVLELWPAATLVRWRMRMKRGQAPDTSYALRLALISNVQALLVVLMVFAATAMARGLGN
jgi:putative membrane protein